MSLIENNDVIQTVSADRSDNAFTFPGPVQPKTLAVPAHKRIGVQRVQHCPPSVDIFRKQDPKQAVGRRHLRALHRWFEHSELLAER